MKIVKPRVAPDARIPAIGYIRVSLAREEMISPELQQTAIEAWAARTNHRIVEWIKDLDKSGRNFKRKIMQAIEAVECPDGEAKVIAVWKYSRFGRNRAGIEINLARIENAGGQLLSATEEVDATTSTGWFQRDMLFSVATFESKRAGEVWKETQDWRRNEGLPAGGAKRFGYIWHQRRLFDPDGTIHLQEERYEPDPVASKAAAELYERRLAGESFRSLAFWLNDTGHRTSRGNLWTVNAVMRYMDSGFAAGYLRLHADCPVADCIGACTNYELVKHPTKHHPQLISEATWQRYLRHRERTKAKPRRSRTGHAYTGHTKCGGCGGGMKRVGPRGNSRYLVCRRRDEIGKGACPGSRILFSDLQVGVRAFLAATAGPGMHEVARTTTVAPLTPANSPEAERERLEAQITRLDRAIGKAMRAYALLDDEDPDGILEAEHKKLLGELRDEKAQLSQKAAALSPQKVDLDRESRLEAVQVAVSLVEEWPTFSAARINALLGLVVDRIDILPDDKGIEVHASWNSEPWRWERPPAAPLKRCLIEELLREDPKMSTPGIVKLAKERGVPVTDTYVRVIRAELFGADDQLRVARRYGREAFRPADWAEREQVRLEAAQRFHQGEDSVSVAKALGVTRRTVDRWRAAWRAQGDAALLSTALPRRSLDEARG